jgi:ABC-type Na+ efflux pump permease subunit
MVLHVLTVLLALGAVVCMIGAIAGMVTHQQSARTGFVLRVVAVVCFAGAVALNVAAH